MWLNRVLSLKRINCVDSSTLFGSFNSSYAVKTQDLPEQIEGDLEASLCFGGTNNKVQVCAFFAWNLKLFLKKVWRPIERFWHHFVSAVQTTTCKCVHFRVKFGAVFEAGLKADRAILSYIFFQYYGVRSDDVILLKSRWNFVDTKTTTAGNNGDNFYPF